MLSWTLRKKITPVSTTRAVRRAQRAASWTSAGFVFAAMGVWSGGCRHAEQAGREARGIIGSVEPTGMVAETEVRTKTWEAVKKRLDELDIEGFNKAVASLAAVTDLLRQRVDRIPEEDLGALASEALASLSAIREQAEAADLAATSRAWQALIEDARAKLAEVPTADTGALVEEMTQLARELRATVRWLDEGLPGALEQSEQLAQRASERVEAISQESIRQIVDRVDGATAEAKAAIEPIARASAQWPETTQRLDAALQTAELAGKVAMVVLGLWGLCAVAWLVRVMRPRAAA